MGKSLFGERHRLNKRAMRDGLHTPRQRRMIRWRRRLCLHPQSVRMMLSGYIGCGLCGKNLERSTPATAAAPGAADANQVHGDPT